MGKTEELKEQLAAAVQADDAAAVKMLTAEIEQQQGPQSFTEAWNYAEDIPAPRAGSFAEAWGFQPGKDKTQ